MKEQILKELNLKKNICFNKKEEIGQKIKIYKSTVDVGTVTEVKEICNIADILEKFDKYIRTDISLDEVIIEIK